MIAQWQTHKTQLRHFIQKRVSDPHAVDDILQDIYLKASTHLHQLKSEGSLKGWLYRIAHNAIMDFYRNQKQHDELPDDLIAEEAPGTLALKELAECLRPLINELPEKYRKPLYLAELKGVPQQEIAQLLGLSLSGAKSRIQRGRVMFRKQMMACCDFEVTGGIVTGYTPKRTSCSRGD